MRRSKRKPYVQFSKKVVVAVTVAVTAIAILAIVFCWLNADSEALVNTVKAYINYATIVFAAYSGNSAVEKWLVYRASSDSDDESASSG